MQTLGSKLHPQDQRHVLSAYVHRFTRDHKPSWAIKPRPDGSAYPVQFASDSDWLDHTLFSTRNDGRLDARAEACCSSPTWPDNPELRPVKA